MKISEMIENLEELRTYFGDIEVVQVSHNRAWLLPIRSVGMVNVVDADHPHAEPGYATRVVLGPKDHDDESLRRQALVR